MTRCKYSKSTYVCKYQAYVTAGTLTLCVFGKGIGAKKWYEL
jgi:hypothetical protein